MPIVFCVFHLLHLLSRASGRQFGYASWSNVWKMQGFACALSLSPKLKFLPRSEVLDSGWKCWQSWTKTQNPWNQSWNCQSSVSIIEWKAERGHTSDTLNWKFRSSSMFLTISDLPHFILNGKYNKSYLPRYYWRIKINTFAKFIFIFPTFYTTATIYKLNWLRFLTLLAYLLCAWIVSKWCFNCKRSIRTASRRINLLAS